MSDFETERHNVGKGWQPLIEKLHADLSALAPGYGIAQIKEKFGGLRYYLDCTPDFPVAIQDQMEELVTEAELASFLICEQCGAPGELRGGSWWKTLCDEHFTARESRKEVKNGEK